MLYELRYHPDVRDVDIPKLNQTARKRIKKAIEDRLSISPHQYGVPLRKTLKGYWKLRVGDYRVVFKIERNEVLIFAIVNRRDVYKSIFKRI
ncbi:MAG TPA: type II toxin-antitoxin system RelE/ParE family toxin [Thermodesulfovibrionales bacterium]|nr:type II toxin-antitoxin system RelE/ParE family toxin [Thermodesulfovibrionales bacterium]